MSLILRGELDWTPCPGGPIFTRTAAAPDRVTRKWQGPATAKYTFLRGYPVGQTDTEFPHCRLQSITLTDTNDGYAEAQIEYVGIPPELSGVLQLTYSESYRLESCVIPTDVTATGGTEPNTYTVQFYSRVLAKTELHNTNPGFAGIPGGATFTPPLFNYQPPRTTAWGTPQFRAVARDTAHSATFNGLHWEVTRENAIAIEPDLD